MPKKTQYPRLRTHVRKGAGGRVYVYYFYDMRPEGKPDVALGRDREVAIAKWDELHNKTPRLKGRIREAITRWIDEELPNYANAETRRNYGRQIRRIDAVFGMMAWHEVEMPHLRQYLRNRRNAKDKTVKAPTQANREMSVFQIVWNWAVLEGLTKVKWPAAGLERSGWKNEESPREFVVTVELFEAVYAEACQFLRDTMDLASATGMRLQDCIKVVLPADNVLHLKAGKTGKKADFDVSLSEVLPQLVERRRGYEAAHLMLISTPDGFPVFPKDLRREWDKARRHAASKARERKHEAFAEQIEAMYLRDMRKMAADLAADLADAQKLLQHSNPALTLAHYRSRAERLTPVR
jgi:hypothetical protein